MCASPERSPAANASCSDDRVSNRRDVLLLGRDGYEALERQHRSQHDVSPTNWARREPGSRWLRPAEPRVTWCSPSRHCAFQPGELVNPVVTVVPPATVGSGHATQPTRASRRVDQGRRGNVLDRQVPRCTIHRDVGPPFMVEPLDQPKSAGAGKRASGAAISISRRKKGRLDR